MAVDWTKAKSVLAGLEVGKSLRTAAKEAGTTHSTILRWLGEDVELANQYARAREIGYALLADEIIEIADDSSGDAVEDEDGNVRQNSEFVNRARLRVDTRKWMLSKVLPKIYGERVEHQHKGEFKVVISPTEARL